MFIDTHCHFNFPPFIDHLAEAINSLERAKVNKIIVPAVTSDHFNQIIRLSEYYPSIYCALGLHPIYCHQKSDLQLLANELDLNHAKLVAIGETGLDSFIDYADIQQQTFFLLQQFDLAKQYHLPLILHSRKTHSLLLALLKQKKLPDVGVIHGFSGSYEEAMQFIRLGFYIGVGGVISYDRAKKTRNAIRKIPLEFIVLETDAPDMPLSGYQGQANRPENIINIFEILVTLRGEEPSYVLNTILMNTLTLFPRINTINFV